MSSRAIIALKAGITDLAATSQGMINKGPMRNYPQNLFKHDLCHNFLDMDLGHDPSIISPILGSGVGR